MLHNTYYCKSILGLSQQPTWTKHLADRTQSSRYSLHNNNRTVSPVWWRKKLAKYRWSI